VWYRVWISYVLSAFAWVWMALFCQELGLGASSVEFWGT